MDFQWKVRKPSPQIIENLQQGLQLSRLLAALLVNRGLGSKESASFFLDPRLRHLRDPFQIPDLEKAASLLWEAIEARRKIVIFGDYDVDGVTATAILVEVLQCLGAVVSAYLPNRKDEGYGLTQTGLEGCLALTPEVLIAVDCGSNSDDLITWMLEIHRIPTIVIDHHQVITPAKKAAALVNCLLSSNLDDHVLCSAGLAFKMAHGLLKKGRVAGNLAADRVDLKYWLDLVALGTIADHVPLTGENRIFVSAGLKSLGTSVRPGVVALKEISERPGEVDCQTVSFQLAPRLNASGRLESAKASLDLLLSKDCRTAGSLATILETQNNERREIERVTTNEAISQVRARYGNSIPAFILEANPKWHIGVVGIVAARIVSEFKVPAIIAGGDGAFLRGSGRSVEGCDLVSCLQECKDLLHKFGGHAMAAGVTLQPENVNLLQERLDQLVNSKYGSRVQPPLHIDLEVLLSEITFEALVQVERMAPHGHGNEPIKLLIKNVYHQRPPMRMGKENQHIKCWVTDGTTTLQAVKWNAKNASIPKVAFDLVATPALNEFNGSSSVQLTILDWKLPTILEEIKS
ncbi:MAG: Single-stranded-DNA-specific exonuclease RecJ [Verrucomicrobiales bacterium]|nr:Single-stranded-DNA-specific exonuclease RecJ [Verrucomicrobiales bacterium]